MDKKKDGSFSLKSFFVFNFIIKNILLSISEILCLTDLVVKIYVIMVTISFDDMIFLFGIDYKGNILYQFWLLSITLQ